MNFRSFGAVTKMQRGHISEPLINGIFRNKRISARLAYLAIVVREKITISTLTGYLLENENLGKLRSNLSVVESEPIFPRWCKGVMF